MRRSGLIILLLCISSSYAADALPQGVLTGHVRPVKWEPGPWGGWVRLDGLYEVPEEDTLYIEPGAKIAVASGTIVRVLGTVIAGRTFAASVEFRAIADSSEAPTATFDFRHASGYSQFSNCHWNGFQSEEERPHENSSRDGPRGELIRVYHSGLRIHDCTFRNCGGVLRADSASWIVVANTSIGWSRVAPRDEHLVSLIAIGLETTAQFYSLLLHNSSGAISVDGADTVRFEGSTFVDNSDVRFVFNDSAFVEFDHVVVERNRVFERELIQANRDVVCDFHNVKAFANTGANVVSLFMFRPGSVVRIDSSTFSGNLVDEPRGHPGPIGTTFANYGALSCSRSILSHGQPNVLLLSGQPTLEPDLAIHADGIGWSQDGWVSSGDTILETDTAMAVFSECCFYGYEKLFMEANLSWAGAQEPHLFNQAADTSHCTLSDPKFYNVATGDLRLSGTSPFVKDKSSAAPVGCDHQVASRVAVQR